MPNVNDILRLIDREIWLVTASHDGQRGGLIATFVNQASIVPELPRMLVGIAKQHHTWSLIEANGLFTLHLLDESHLDWVWRFGLQSSTSPLLREEEPGGHCSPLLLGEGLGVRVFDKFADMPTLDAVAWLTCRVETSMDTGDRTLYLAEVLDGKLEKPTPPLTLKRLLQLAPPERSRELRDGMARDAGVDAAAIQAWREGHKIGR
jgi:flavin reductase (DIM6/NTAB) family NADH-FMN oxidoreductase RutF